MPLSYSLEGIFDEFLSLVLSTQPKGPYRISGYCLGGIVAFEVARRLIATGENVEIVAIIDAPTVSARPSVQLLLSAIRYARPINGPMVDRIARRTWHICSQLDKPIHSLRSWLKKALKRHIEEPLSRAELLSTYAPEPLAVPVIYFSAEHRSFAWRKICSSFEIIEIGGTHRDVVRDPANLAKIANALKVRLATQTASRAATQSGIEGRDR